MAMSILYGMIHFDNKLESTTREKHRDSMNALVNTIHASISRLVGQYQQDLQYWSQKEDVLSLTQDLLRYEGSTHNLIHINDTQGDKVLAPIRSELDYKGYFIMSANGINLASSRIENIGKKSLIYNDQKSWKKAWSGEVAFTKIMKSDVALKNRADNMVLNFPTMFVLAPIKNNQDKVIAIIALRIKPEDFLWNVLDRARIGLTGVSYAVSTDGLLLSPLHRFQHSQHDALSINVLNKEQSLEKFLSGPYNANLQGYRTFDSTHIVLGIWKYLPIVDFYIVTEMDFDEAFEVYSEMSRFIKLVMFLLLILMLIGFVLMLRKFSSVTKYAKDNEKRLKSIFENSQGVIYRSLSDDNYSLEFLSSSIEDLSGYNKDDFLDHNRQGLIDIIHPEDVLRVIESKQLKINKHEKFQLEYRIICKSGKIKTVIEKGIGSYSTSGECEYIDGFIVDISDKVALEQQRKIAMHSAKLASIGKLSAGVAHEINNPLAIIKGYLYTLRRFLPLLKEGARAEIEETFAKIDASADRIANIVKGLRSYARTDDIKASVFAMDQLISECVDMLSEIYINEGITLIFDYNGPNVMIEGKRGEVQQVIINLISNAKDATEGKEKRAIFIRLESKSNFAVVRVSDSGHGIRHVDKDKIFDPFFTTKDIGKGTGIGLSIVANIVEQHGGEITVEDTSAAGSTFMVKLPIGEQRKDADVKDKSQATFDLTNINILLIDDEPEILESFSFVLSELGAATFTFIDPQQALKFLESIDDKIHFIITDFLMPNHNPKEFTQKLRSMPQLKNTKILISTGDIAIEESSKDVTSIIDGLIYKPFDINDICTELKKY